jgi:WD40-like Beta Propeller Repeat
MINLILIFSLFSQGPYEYDPALSWFVLETDHFAIHIPSIMGLTKEEKNLARRFAWACEEADSRLAPFMQWQPKDKVNVVIADFYDYAQGWSLPFPHNTITVMPTHPAGDLTNYDDWFLTLILHEYTHSLEMDKVKGFFSFLRKIFGRVSVPGAITPLGLLEGMAVYDETKFTQFGRGRSPEYAMKIRTAALANRLLPIDQTTTYEMRKYPDGESPYIYGGEFFQFLANRYGDEKLVEYIDYNSKCLPFFTNFASRKVFGTSFYKLWQEWQQAEIESDRRVDTSETTESMQVTKVGFDMYAPLFSKYGEKIYFISYNPNELPSIKSLDLITKQTRTLIRGYIGKTISLSADGGELLFSMRNVNKNYYDFDDLFLFSLTTNELFRITNGLRARDPDFTPSGDKIIFVENGLGKNRLILMERKGMKPEPLIEEDEYTQFSQPKFSPDGKKIAVAIWQEGGFQDILVLDLEAGWNLPITFDRATDVQPAWTPDSKYLLFSSDRTGVFNLYAYSWETRQIYQVTNVKSGAFFPTVSPDGKRIAFLLYSESGYDINFINFKPGSWVKAKILPESLPEIPAASEVRVNLHAYDPLASIFPRFWLPLIYYDTTFSFGFLTAGADVLLQHIVLLAVNYRPKEKNPFAYFLYDSDKFHFNLYGFYKRNEQGLGISGYLPFYSTFSYHLLLPYYEFDYHDKVFRSGLGLEWQTSNAKRYSYSISPEEGMRFLADAVYFSRYIGSTDNLTRLILSYGQYLASPIRHHVLAFELNGATALGDSAVKQQYTLGGTDGLFSVRGYDEDSITTQNALKATVEYRFPLVWVERGISTAPFFLSNFSGAVGLDAGLGWDGFKMPSSRTFTDRAKLGIFVELQTSFVFAYLAPVSLKIGYGHGLINNGTNQIYISAGSSLSNLLFEKKRLNRKDLVNLLFNQ